MVGFPAQAGLIAYWDSEGNVEESISSTTGTLTGAAAADGAAIAPVGSNSLNLPSGGSLDTNTAGGLGGTGSFTVFGFIQTSTTSNATIFSYNPSGGGTGGADLRLFAQGNGNFRIAMSQGASFEASDPGWDLGDGTTHAVAAVFDSSTGDSFRDVDLYVNGTFYDVTSGTDHTINLGADEVIFGSSGSFDGLIDDVAIYDTALSLTELDDIRDNGVPEPGSLALLGLGGLLIGTRRRRA